MSGDNFAATGAALVASVFSAAALALDEEESINQEEGIQLKESCGGHHSADMNEKCPRKYICWDRQRAELLPWAGANIWDTHFQTNFLFISKQL